MIITRSILQQFAEAIQADADVQEQMNLLKKDLPFLITIGRIPEIESNELDNLQCPAIYLSCSEEITHDNQTQEITVNMGIHIKDEDVSTVSGIRTFEGYRKAEEIFIATLTAIISTAYGKQIEQTSYSINSDFFPVWRLTGSFTIRPQNGLAETITE